MDTVKVGIIGTSKFADMVHLPLLKSHKGAELVAICGRNQDRADQIAKKYGFRETYGDYEQMIQQCDLDAVVIATPEDLHYPMTMTALEKPLHVLCAKSLALNATQAEEMVRKADASGVKHMVYFTNRWFPHHDYFGRLIRDAFIGRCLYFHFRMMYAASLRKGRGYTWRDDGKRSNGVLSDLGSHMIDLCHHWIDDIRSVSASLAVHAPISDPRHPTVPANDSAVLTLETERGVHGIIHASRVAAVSHMQHYFSIHGETGILELRYSHVTGGQITVLREGEMPTEVPLPRDFWNQPAQDGPFVKPLVQWLSKRSVFDRLFVDSILGDTEPLPSFRDGLRAQRVIDGALESATTGSRIIVGE